MIFRTLSLLLLSASAMAAPQTIEVWFLSNAKVSELNKLLDRPQNIYRAKTAQLQCQEVGDFCFDPQFGLYKKDDLSDVSANKLDAQVVHDIPSAKSIDRDLINCDKNNYFDIFCGKASAAKTGTAKLDLWIDTSSSMREFDFSDKEGGCFRQSFVRRLDQVCGFNQKVNVMMFDTSIKQAGSIDQLCTNVGLNDQKRLIDWIERSDAKKLVIVTDINEYTKEFADYIESKNGKYKGDKDTLTAKGLLDLVDELEKTCK